MIVINLGAERVQNSTNISNDSWRHYENYVLFISGLYNGALNSADDTASNDVISSEWWTGRDVKGVCINSASSTLRPSA